MIAELIGSSNVIRIHPSVSSFAIQRMTPLRNGFKPGLFDVICAKGKEAHNHPGNRRYRNEIMDALVKYSQAKSKLEKSVIVSNIVDSVRLASPQGGFVKQLGDGVMR